MVMLRLKRDVIEDGYTLGKLYAGDVLLGETCEDADRKLEEGGKKVYGQTAIPRGTYRVTLSHSPRFGKILPELLNVPGFSGIRIHGGNTADDSLGCILLGKRRDSCGIGNCAPAMAELKALLMTAMTNGELVWIEVQ